MVVGIKYSMERYQYVNSGPFYQLETLARHQMRLPMEKVVGKAIKHLFEKYDSDNGEKYKLWRPVHLISEDQEPQKLYLNIDQDYLLFSFASRAGAVLGKKVSEGDVIRSAIAEYLKAK